jgi:glutathione S-transferase
MTAARAPAAAEPAGVSLVTRRLIRAPAQRLFDAWTQPALLLQWWGPRGVTCIGAEVDLRVGGAYRLGNRFPDGRVVWIHGQFEEIAPPHRLCYTWSLEGDPRPPERVTVRFEPQGAATEVIVVHERIGSPELRERHAASWEGCLDGLEALASVGTLDSA